MSVISKDTYALPPGARVLVTGANGYIGSHVVDILLSLGYLVRGTVRAEKPWLNELFDSKYGPGKFETVIVPRIDDKDALAKVLGGVSGVVHVATDVTFEPDADRIIPFVVSSTEAVLKAAAESSVKRVVLTSSSTAAYMPQPGVDGIVVTQETWNDAAIEGVRDEKTPADAKPYLVYGASKTEGERAAWKWVEENKPGYTFNSVLPNFTLGKVLHREIPGSTMKWAVTLLQGKEDNLKIPAQWYINVEDAARIHAVALLDPNVKSERLFAFAAPFTWADVINIFRKLRPTSQTLVNAPENPVPDLSDVVPAKRAEGLLKSFFGKPGWIGLEQSLKEGIDSLGL